MPRYVEALLRWDHPDGGLLAPAEFLVDEDDSALLVRIGWSVMIEAAHRAGEWRRAYPDRPVTVSVNLSAGHLANRELSTRIEHLLLDNEVPGPHALALEISERHLLPHRRPNPRPAAPACATSASRSSSTTSARPRPPTDVDPTDVAGHDARPARVAAGLSASTW